MSKKLTKRIEERLQKKTTSQRAANLSDFLANKTEIEEALAANWSVKTIWETLHDEGKIKVSYAAFNGHVNKHIRHKQLEENKTTPEETKKEEQQEKTLQQKTDTNEFKFNSTPNKEDLI